MFSFLGFLWLVRTTKSILFWLYLWQLKEYHIGRFLDHFQTEKGKNLILNKINLIKAILLLTFQPLPLLLFFIAFILYILEFFKALIDFLKGHLKKPVLTKKTVFLILAGLLLEILVLLILFLNVGNIVWFAFWLLVFDVATPIITSITVLIFQPLAVFGRNQIIKKAKEKRAQVDELRSSSPSLGSPCAPRSVFKDLLVVGITGSYGKTSTKEFLYTILAEKFGENKVLKTKEHQNSEIGISQCVLNDLKPEHEIFICEMGAYNRGGIKLLCDIAKPKIGIVTGVNEQHLATFGTMENLLSAEGGRELIESLPEDGVAFFNAKNKYCVELYQKTKIKKILYGENVKLAGFENIEGAKAVARELGMSEEEISKACQKIDNEFGGIQIKNGINSLNVVDATYSANPDSVIAHLEYLTLRYPQGKKIIIMPCLIELGKASKEVHRRIGQKIAEACDLAIITTKDRFKEIKEAASAKATASRGAEILFMENPKAIFEKIKNFCQPGDIVLLESRVPSQLIEQLFSAAYQTNPFQPISISLSPNTEKDDVRLALKLLFQPWQWKMIDLRNQSLVEEDKSSSSPFAAARVLEEEFKKYLGVKYAFAFNSGRSALMAILNSLELEKDDEVLLQGFTCNSAVNPILNKGAKPVFVDIDETINLDQNDLKKKITAKSKAVMVQHNFGWPAQIDEISEIVRQNDLFLIEDCAHSLGAEYKGKLCGTFGDAAFFSFGRDKIISSVFGGMAITNNEEIGERIKEFQEKLDFPSNFWIFQQLLHPILTHFVVLPAYALNQYLGRIIFGFLHKFSILSKGVYKKEKRGETSEYFPKKLPNALAYLALNQFTKIERFNKHRRELAKFYEETLKEKFELPLSGKKGDVLPTFLRYPILVGNEDTDKILKAARKRKIYLDDGWRKSPIVPPDTSLEKMEYRLGACPRAEKIAKSILNLPTHINISKRDAQKIIDFLKNYGSSD